MKITIRAIISWIINHAVALSIGVGICMVIGGVLFYVIFPKVFADVIEWQFQLKDGNIAFWIWREIPVPMKTKVYVFDLLNAREFIEGRELAKLRETGPFVYRQRRKREAIIFSHNGKKVSYYERFSFEFEPSESNGNLEDRVTVPNVPIISLFAIINSAISIMPPNVVTPVATNIVSAVLSAHGEELFHRVTVRELLEGRDVPLLNTIDTLLKPLKSLGVKIPEYNESDQKLKDNKYGVIWGRNDRKGPFEVYTKHKRLTEFVSYKEKSQLSQWRENTQCSKLSDSTEGFYFGPLTAKVSSSVRIFDDFTCRTLRADFERKLNVNGVNAFRFRFSSDLFSLNIKENQCYCHGENKCIDGVTDLNPCLSGAPLALSYPHFLYADKRLSNRVIGLKPDDDEHRGYLDIDSKFGITVRGSGRFQINVMLKPVKFVPQMQKIKPTLLPYVWIDESAEVKGFLFMSLKYGIYLLILVEYGSIASVIFGTLLVISMGGYAMMRQNKKNKQLMEQKQKKNLMVSRIKSKFRIQNKVTDDYDESSNDIEYSERKSQLNDPQMNNLYPSHVNENQRNFSQHHEVRMSAHSANEHTLAPIC